MNRRCRARHLLAAIGVVAALAAAAGAPAIAEGNRQTPTLGDGGLYVQPWFLQSFLDLREDLAEARRKGKRLVVIVEQKGCPYCRELHAVNFADPAIRDFVRANFEVVQLDLWGARRVTDFDGREISEKAFARKYGVRFTPTVLFFANEVPKGKAGKAAEVARMPGYLPPNYFLMFFRYVKDEAFRTTNFRAYVKRQGSPRE